jgi:hypothetical protein
VHIKAVVVEVPGQVMRKFDSGADITRDRTERGSSPVLYESLSPVLHFFDSQKGNGDVAPVKFLG